MSDGAGGVEAVGAGVTELAVDDSVVSGIEAGGLRPP
jgi:Zn-dependent alcohol dehydrogenase